jgi:hypothetical protein
MDGMTFYLLQDWLVVPWTLAVSEAPAKEPKRRPFALRPPARAMLSAKQVR